MAKETKIKIIVLAGNKLITKFMQCAGGFESGKVYARFYEIEMGGTPIDESEQSEKCLIDSVYKKIQHAPHETAIYFIHIKEIDGIKNIKYPAIILRKIQTVSNGDTWFMLEDKLKEEGYEVTTDEYRNVLSAETV